MKPTGTHAWGRRVVLLVLLSCAALYSHSGLAQEELRWRLALNDADVRDVVREMSSILGATVVLDPRVQGRITVMSEASLDREGVRRLFYSVLDAHNFTVIDEGERILITPVAEAKTRASPLEGRHAGQGQFVTQVIALNNTTAADLSSLLRPLISPNGYLGPSSSGNALVLTDAAVNVRRIQAVVAQLDSGLKNGHSVLELRQGLAEPLARVIEQSLGKQGIEAGGMVIPDIRNNRLIMIGNPPTRQRLLALARALDTPASASDDHSRVVRLRYADAKQLADVLDSLPGPETSADKSAVTEQQALVKADESQNALVLIAEPERLRTLEHIVEQLDQPRSQVMLHAAIIEVSGDIANALGVQWGAQTGGLLGAINFPGAGVTLPGLKGEDYTLPDGAVLRAGSDRFGVLINALASDTRNNILSTPSLLTLDNQEAEILVGQNVPFKSGSYQTPGSGSENPYTTVTRQDIGIKLKIRPHINDGETLRLEVEQENSEIASSIEGLDDLITNKRSLKSTILADDGQVIVIGGLIKDSVRTRQSGVPLLRDIPWLGALFRWSSDTREKTNLMIFLRPTIIRGKESLTELTGQQYRDLKGINSRHQNSLLLPAHEGHLFQPRDEGAVNDVRAGSKEQP